MTNSGQLVKITGVLVATLTAFWVSNRNQKVGIVDHDEAVELRGAEALVNSGHQGSADGNDPDLSSGDHFEVEIAEDRWKGAEVVASERVREPLNGNRYRLRRIVNHPAMR